MTVSRVVNGGTKVRKDVCDAIHRAISELNYRPNLAARTLAVGEDLRIGLLLDDSRNTFSAELLMNCIDHARLNRAQVVVGRCDTGGSKVEAIRDLLSQGLDGVIVSPPFSDSSQVFSVISSANIPAVAVGNSQPRMGQLAVCIDDYSASAAMTRHLLSLSHQRIGFIVGDDAQNCSEWRLEGYKAALAEAAVAIDCDLIRQGAFTYRSGLKASNELLRLKSRPTAIFASNDNMAAAAISVAHGYRLEVPRDLTVVGFDDTDISRCIWPELTTVRQPIPDMSCAALDLLCGAIKQKLAGQTMTPRKVILSFALVHRDSDGPPLARSKDTAVPISGSATQ
jgi:LacI family transcriptional regulator, galactose operon repressor